MSKVYGNVIKAIKGEDIVIPSLVVKDDIVSSTFTYIGVDVVTPVEDDATVTTNADPLADPPVTATISTINYTLTDAITSTLANGLYDWCIRTVNSTGLSEVIQNGFLIIEDDIYVIPIPPVEPPN